MQVHTLGHQNFCCLPTGTSVAEHLLGVPLKPANKATAKPSPAQSCLLPPWLLEKTDERTHWAETFSSKKKEREKKKKTVSLFLAAPVLSPDPSTTTHTFVPMQHRGQSKNKGSKQQLGMPVLLPRSYLSSEAPLVVCNAV